jgi:hypothetical protein
MIEKLPWVKGFVAIGGIIQTMRCIICSFIENKDKIVECKWNILTKHVGYRIAIFDLPQFGIKKGGNTLLRIVPI